MQPTSVKLLGHGAVLLVNVNDLLHLVVAPHENAGPVVDMLGHHRQHPFHSAIDSLSASW